MLITTMAAMKSTRPKAPVATCSNTSLVLDFGIGAAGGFLLGVIGDEGQHTPSRQFNDGGFSAGEADRLPPAITP